MNESLELVPTNKETAVARPAPIDAASILETAVRGGVTKENVEVVKELVALAHRERSFQAEQAFNAAYAAMQKEMPKVHADKPVRDRAGNLMYQYCDEEEIDAQARPIYQAHGFAIRFSQEHDGNKFTAVATLMHTGGHSIESRYTVRSGSGAPGMNETKCDESASTVARREALCNCLNIIRRKRGDDPRMLGQNITAQQAEELERRVDLLNANKPAFLQFAGAKTFAEIKSEVYPVLDRFLQSKEKRGR